MIGVLIVVSVRLYRLGLAQLLGAHDAFTVVGSRAVPSVKPSFRSRKRHQT